MDEVIAVPMLLREGLPMSPIGYYFLLLFHLSSTVVLRCRPLEPAVVQLTVVSASMAKPISSWTWAHLRLMTRPQQHSAMVQTWFVRCVDLYPSLRQLRSVDGGNQPGLLVASLCTGIHCETGAPLVRSLEAP